MSELVRGRVKLEEVNRVRTTLGPGAVPPSHSHLNPLCPTPQVYEAICGYFAAGKKKALPPLTVQELTTMGHRITGQTGEAKLKVLRALKIINVGKDGITLAY